MKLCTQGKYKDYCKKLNEMSTKSHDAKKAGEQNLSLSKQKNMKKKRQESEELSSQIFSPEEGKSK